MRIAFALLIGFALIYVVAGLALQAWFHHASIFGEWRHAFASMRGVQPSAGSLLRLQIVSLIDWPRLRGLRARA